MSVYVNLPNGEHAQRVVMAGAETGQGDVPVSSNGILPVDIQSRLASTIQTHSGVTIGATSSNTGSWIDCDGFTEIGVTMTNDAVTSSYAYLEYSNDGVNVHAQDVTNIIAGSTQRSKVGTKPIASRWIRVSLRNDDATPHTMSAWAYLKA